MSEGTFVTLRILWEALCFWKEILHSWTRLSHLSKTYAHIYSCPLPLMEEQVKWVYLGDMSEIFIFQQTTLFASLISVWALPTIIPSRSSFTILGNRRSGQYGLLHQFPTHHLTIMVCQMILSFKECKYFFSDSSGLYSSRYVPRRYSLHNQSPMIRQISPIRLTNNHQQAKFFHRSSVPNIKFGYPGMLAPSSTASSLRDNPKQESNENLDNIETQLENICLSVTNQVIDKEEM